MAHTESNDNKEEVQSYNYCALPLAAYACRPDESRGRIYEEPESATRTPFQRDRDRIIHASAFRRLKYKTQVFVYSEGDHYRTRLTHTLEVAQITRSLARALMVNEDLAEAIALSHDLGHTPFAHIGEDYLQRCMEPYDGFEHNDQSLRILTKLERKYPGWPGLNLTWETLEGVVKHNGPVKPDDKGKLPPTLYDIQHQIDLEIDTFASLEAQIAAISDDVAYNNHDVEDGLRARMFDLDDLSELALMGPIIKKVREEWPDVSTHYIVQETVREMIGAMVTDVLAETKTRLEDLKPKSPRDVREASQKTVAFSSSMYTQVEELRAFLLKRMYRHYSVNRIWNKVEKIIPDLFHTYMTHYNMLPDDWQIRVEKAGGLIDNVAQARIVCDYIAGMTDRYAIREHEKLFNLYRDIN
ncbi:MAG: deoxyguanosinetriphosphate triphosphohydrolase [Pseudomonadota bacterium]